MNKTKAPDDAAEYARYETWRKNKGTTKGTAWFAWKARAALARAEQPAAVAVPGAQPAAWIHDTGHTKHLSFSPDVYGFPPRSTKNPAKALYIGPLAKPEGEDPMARPAGPFDPDSARIASYARLSAAYCVQQKFPIPNQMALVWRADLGRMITDLTHKQAFFDHFREAPAPAAELIAAFESLLNGCRVQSFIDYESGDGENVGKRIEAARAAYHRTAGPSADIDKIALDTATTIMALVKGQKPLGGDVQLKAKIQCAVQQAIESDNRPAAIAPASLQDDA